MQSEELFSVIVEPEGYLRVVLVNTDSEERFHELKELTEKIINTILEEEEKRHEKVRTLVDLTHLSKYSPKSIALIVEMLHKTHPHTLKTATFGARPDILLAQQAVTALAGRENLRAFKTEDEAKMWLLARQ